VVWVADKLALSTLLSVKDGVNVLLAEAGDEDTNPLIAMPRGFGELLGDPTTVWHYPTRPFGPTQRVEYWVRGKTLGGSSSVNGLVYNRGSGADYDALERLGNPGWGWDDMLPVFKKIENNELGASDVRGAGGPLHVSTVDGTDPLLEDVITAGAELGWRRMRDLNETDEERIGYAMATIRAGQRVNAANAFLHPVMDRPNLTVALCTVVDQVVLAGGRAVGVRGRQNGQAVEAKATREVILATGSIATPKILQLSGIGPAEALRSAGVDIEVDSPNVGARLREHLAFHAAVPARGGPRVQQAAQHRGRPAGGGGGVPDDPARAVGGALVRHRRVLQDPPGARPPRCPVPDRAVLDAAARTRQGGPGGAGAGHAVRRLHPAAGQ
jgi:choline dehydrogenase-like flavoprotein